MIQSDQELFRAHLLHRYSDNSTSLSLRHELPFEEIKFGRVWRNHSLGGENDALCGRNRGNRGDCEA